MYILFIKGSQSKWMIEEVGQITSLCSFYFQRRFLSLNPNFFIWKISAYEVTRTFKDIAHFWLCWMSTFSLNSPLFSLMYESGSTQWWKMTKSNGCTQCNYWAPKYIDTILRERKETLGTRRARALVFGGTTFFFSFLGGGRHSINTLYEPASFNGPRHYKAFSKITPFIPFHLFGLRESGTEKYKNCKKNKRTSGAMRGVARWWRGEEVATSEKYFLT